MTWESTAHKSARDHRQTVTLLLWSLISLKSCQPWTPGDFWWSQATGGIFHFLPWLMEPKHAYSNSRSKNQRKTEKETMGKKKSGSNMKKKSLKLYFYEQGATKIARWFLEKNRWHFTCQQSVLCNLKTSKGPLHCHSSMDPSETSHSGCKNIIKNKRGNVSKDRPVDTSGRSICRSSPNSPKFLKGFPEHRGGKGPSELVECLLDPCFWENSKFWRGANSPKCFHRGHEPHG